MFMNQPNQMFMNQPNQMFMNQPNQMFMNQPNQMFMNQTNQTKLNGPPKKISLKRNTMKKIPMHLMPSGVLLPKKMNYH